MVHAGYLYYLSKFTEFVDTVSTSFHAVTVVHKRLVYTHLPPLKEGRVDVCDSNDNLAK
jgi:hypothetical protein